MKQENNFYIFTLTNGFVHIGQLAQNNTIKYCYNVRKSGTTKGFGQIAIEGLQENTILDFCGLVQFNPDHLIFKTLLTDEAVKSFKDYAGI